MSAYLLTPRALDDLFSIWSYIAEHNREAADRVESTIYQACRLLTTYPGLGHTRPDLTARPLLFWTSTRFPNYTVVYKPGTVPLEIVAVLHGKQEIRSVLAQRADL